MNIRIHGKLTKWGIGKSIYPELWDKSTQRPTKDKVLLKAYKNEEPNLRTMLSDIATRIANVESIVKKYLLDVEVRGEIVDSDEMKKALNAQFRTLKAKGQIKTSSSLNDYIATFLEGIADGSITVNRGKNHGKPYKPSAIKTWKSWASMFGKYQKVLGKLDWETIDLSMYRKFIHYHNMQGYSTNYTGKQIKMLKVILRRGHEDGIHNNIVYSHREFRALTADVDHIALHPKEVDLIYNLNLRSDSSSKLDFHRKVFLIGCYTALRISDIQRIKREHITESNGKSYLIIRTLKTDEEVQVPLNRNCLAILESLGFKVGKITEAHFNRNLKVICKLAGIVNEVEINKSEGGKNIKISKKQYELVSAHSSRRTAITNMFRSGNKSSEIRLISGHKTEASFMRYLKYSLEENAIALSENSFFQ